MKVLLQKSTWRTSPHFANTPAEEFLDFAWQRKHTLQAKKLVDFLSSACEKEFAEDVAEGLKKAPMSVRITPYIASRINWSKPREDPLRKQFLPLASELKEDHPMLALDSLHEQSDSPVPGLVHRYPNKALFLPLSVCPVYCRFCTRSYGVGGNTASVQKNSFLPIASRWEAAFEYIRKTPALQDIVVSGGDAFYLEPEHLQRIGNSLLEIPHIRRIRIATKGLCVAPMRFITDEAWTGAVEEIVQKGRSMNKHVAIHTHFNHPNEVSDITEEAARILFQKAIPVRNQTVLLRGVNDDVETMSSLISKLSEMNVQPYYVYQGDMVKGVEDLRTPLSTILELEKHIRGSNAGFYTPNFIVDMPGGGGKRLACSFDSYDREAGVATFSAPSVKKNTTFLYFDPLHSLSKEMQEKWKTDEFRAAMTQRAKLSSLQRMMH